MALGPRVLDCRGCPRCPVLWHKGLFIGIKAGARREPRILSTVS